MQNHNNLKFYFNRGMLLFKKYSPEIFLGLGIGGSLTATFLACKATLEAEKIAGHALKEIERIRESYPDDSKESLEQRRAVIIPVIMKFAQLYGPMIVLEVLSIGSLINGHRILSGRNAALLGAYKLLEVGFNEYRQRVIEKYGDSADKYLRFGIQEEPKKKRGRKKAEECETPPCEKIAGEPSMYARFFDESSPQWRQTATENMYFLRAQQNYANDLLNAHGHVFLNEIYDILGFPRTSYGCIVGWVKGNGDGYVDFGIYDPRNGDFVNEYNPSILLDFNVDGVVYDLI